MVWGLISQAQESGQDRLESAQSGGKDVAWPRKPDQRLSSLSGKMKDFREISGQEYEGTREFRSERVYEDREASRLMSVPMWSMNESAQGKKVDAFFSRDSSLELSLIHI